MTLLHRAATFSMEISRPNISLTKLLSDMQHLGNSISSSEFDDTLRTSSHKIIEVRQMWQLDACINVENQHDGRERLK